MTRAPSLARLRVEFCALFVAFPVAAAVLLPPGWLFPALFVLMAVGLGLLAVTPGFRWGELWRGAVDWRRMGLLSALTAAVSLSVVLALSPGSLFMPGRAAPGLLAMILLLYPVLSALPQELVYRPLFFRRYAAILPPGWGGVWLNAGLFSLAHLMYWSWVPLALTLAGGVAFAHAYRMRGSFPEALVLHALAGNLLFLFGLGTWFYSGNVTRPF